MNNEKLPSDNEKLKQMFNKFQKEDPAKALESMNKKLDLVHKKAEKVKDSLIKRHKNEILGAILVYKKTQKDDIPRLLIISDIKKKNNKAKIEHILKIEKDGNNLAKKELKVSSYLLEEIWESATRGQYGLLQSIVSGRILHDKGDWIKSLKAVELHKFRMLKKFEKYVISYVIAGSLIRGEANPNSDVDVSLIIDDTDVTRTTSAELKARLRDIALKEARDAERDAGIRGKLNVQVWILTDYWMGLRRAEPIFYTTLRDGISLYDRGMFAPWKLMLKKGMLIPSPESIRRYIDDGKKHVERFNYKFKSMAMEDFFWACIYPAQGLLMLQGVPPGAPSQVGPQMKENLVKKGILDIKYVKIFEKIHKVRKDLEYGKLKSVSPEEVVNMAKSAQDFVEAVEKAYNSLEKRKVKSKIDELKNRTKEDVKLVLKVAGVKSNKKNIASALQSELIEKGLARSKYKELIEQLETLNKDLTSLSMIDSLEYNLDNIRDETINIINSEKGLNKNKHRLTLKYGAGNKQKVASIWLLKNRAFMIKDLSNQQSPVYKYSFDGTGKLSDEQKSSLKVLENKLSTYSGEKARITSKTINQLKEMLDKNLQLLIG